MTQQQDLRREIGVLKYRHTSRFDNIAEDILMLSSNDCAIKQRLENTENESERIQIEIVTLKEENDTFKIRPEDKPGRKRNNLSK